MSIRTSLRSMPRNVWVLGVASLFTDLSSEMIHSILPVFLVAFMGTSVTMVGLIEGLGESIASITKVFSGALSDYLGRRKALVVFGYGLSMCVRPLFALAQTPFWVLIARACDRTGKGIRGAPRDALLADSVALDKRGAAFGLRQSLDTVGAIFGPALAFLLLIMMPGNYRAIMWCAVVPGILAVLVLIFGVEEPCRSKEASRKELENPLSLSQLKRLGNRFWCLTAAALVFSLGNSSEAFLLLRLRSLGVADMFIPLSLVLMNVVYMLSAYPLGALSDRTGRFQIVLSAFILFAAVYSGFAFADAAWHAWLLLTLFGLYLGMSQGVLRALVADTVPIDLRGTAFGFINLATGVMLLPASLLAGGLWDNVSERAPFAAGSVLAIVAAGILFLTVRDEKNG